jgi:hypothetical protein
MTRWPDREVWLLSIGFGLVWAIGIGWGLPEGFAADRIRPWGHDDYTPLGPLIEAHALFIQRPEFRWVAYPQLHDLVLAACYAPYLGWLWLTGEFSNPSALFPHGFHDPGRALATLTLIARSVAVVMGVGIVLAAREIGRTLWSPRAGLWCALFAAVCQPMFYYSRTGNLDGPYMFWSALALCVFARILRGEWTAARGLWLGAFVACGVATKDQAANVFVLPALALLALHARALRANPRPALVTLAAAAAVYTVASGLLFDPERWLAHVRFVLGIGENAVEIPGHAKSLAGYQALALDTWQRFENGVGIPFALLAFASIARDIARDRRRALLALAALSVLLTFVLPTRYVLIRYLEPAMFVCSCFAGGLASDLLAGARTRALGAVLALVALAIPAWRGVELTHAMLRDSRVETAAWLRANACAGDRIGYFGPFQKLPRMGHDLAPLVIDGGVGTRWDLSFSDAEARAREPKLAELAPEWILLIPDHTIAPPHLPYGSALPPQLRDALVAERLGYVNVKQFETPPLFVEPPQLLQHVRVVNPRVELLARVDIARTPRECARPR